MDNKRFKALVTLLLALIFVVSLSACGMGENAPGSLNDDSGTGLGELTANNETDGVVEFPNNDESAANGTEKADKDSENNKVANVSSNNKNNIGNNTSNDNKTNTDSSEKKPSTNNSGASSGSTSNPTSERMVTIKEPIYEYVYWIKDAGGTYLYTTTSSSDFQEKKIELINDPNVDPNWTWGSGNVVKDYKTHTMSESDYIGSPWEGRTDCIIEYN